MALPPVNLFEALEVVPGGRFNGDPATEALVNYLNNILVQITNTVNAQGDNISTVTLGQGSGVRPIVIGQTTAGRSNTALNTLTKGNCVLRLHSSGQLIVAWKEFTGSGSLYEIFLKKSAAPYTTWTNLAGDSQDPTILAPAFNQSNNHAILLCENRATGDINVFTQDQTAGAIKQYIYAYDGENFALSSANNTVASTPGVYLGDVLSTNSTLVMLCTQGGLSVAGNVLYAPTANPTAWSQVAKFADIYYSGAIYSFSSGPEQKRLVDMGDGRILALMEVRDTSGNTNIAWALSATYGVTWPEGDGIGANQELNYPDQASGVVIPQSGTGVWYTSNIIGAGFGGGSVVQCWEAAHIAGTSRVGLAFLGKPDPTTAGQKAGVLYTEFDADTLTWTDQSDHVILTPQTLSASSLGTSDVLGFNNGFFEFRICGGKALCGSDGVMRVFWMHGYSAGNGAQDVLTGVHYRRLSAIGDATDTSQWSSEREAVLFCNIAAADVSANRFRKGEFLGCKEGLVVVNGKTFFPVLWTEMQGLTSKDMAFASLYLALLPVALLDLP